MCALSEETLRVGLRIPLARTQTEPISWMVGNPSFIGYVRLVRQPELAHPILQGGTTEVSAAGEDLRVLSGMERLDLRGCSEGYFCRSQLFSSGPSLDQNGQFRRTAGIYAAVSM